MMRGRLSSWRFWLITLAALAGVAATFSLGRWQLSRAAQKEALHAAIEEKQTLPAIGLRDVLAAPDLQALLHRRVALRGTWLERYTVFLDNRQMNGKQGFFVVTPLQLEGSPAVVLVQRGWAQRDFEDRTHLPAVDTPAGTVALEGRIAPPPAKLYQLSGAETGPIRQNLDLAEFGAETRLPLLGVSVLQTGAAGGGLERNWPEVSTGVERNYGYAFQWFGLCSLIAILYVWFQFIKPWLRRRPAHVD